MPLYDYLVLRGFLGDSKLEVPLSGVGSSSGKVSNSEPSLLIARALRGLVGKEEKTRHICRRRHLRCIKGKVGRIVLCCAISCNSYNKPWVYLCLKGFWMGLFSSTFISRRGMNFSKKYSTWKMVRLEAATFLGEHKNTAWNRTIWTQNKLWY